MTMSYRSSKNRRTSVKERRGWLIQSLQTHLLPVLLEQGFAVAPAVAPGHSGPVERELVLALPLGRLVRHREGGVDLIEIDFRKYRRAAFRIAAGVAPKEGLMTLTGHWPAEDIHVGWLNEFYVMYALPRWRVSFFTWHWPYQSPTQGDYQRLAQRVAGFVPELELALREGGLGPHMRRFLIPRTFIRQEQTDAVV
jgi:hypothetical protein